MVGGRRVVVLRRFLMMVRLEAVDTPWCCDVVRFCLGVLFFPSVSFSLLVLPCLVFRLCCERSLGVSLYSILIFLS